MYITIHLDISIYKYKCMRDLFMVNLNRNVDWLGTIILMYAQDVQEALYIFVSTFTCLLIPNMTLLTVQRQTIVFHSGRSASSQFNPNGAADIL